MTEKIKQFDTKRIDQSLIEFIQTLLDEAKSGELLGVALCKFYHDGEATNAWHIHRCSDRRVVLCATTELNFEMMTNRALADESSILSRAIEG